MLANFARLDHFNGIVRPAFGLGFCMRGLFDELKHRNVFRVGIAYVIAGWLLAQVADLASDAFEAPAWVMQMLVVLLLVGLPIALFLTWAYELTPEGVKKAADVPEGAAKDPRSGQALNRITLVALLIALGWIAWNETHDDAAVDVSTNESVTDKSIAVLPFADFSPGGDYAWFADGLTDEILNALARTRDLRVASRTSSFQYRGEAQNIPEVAAALGVAHILEGSVRRAGDRIRVTAQLIRASDDAHLWSETFDASSEDSIEIQETIAFEIASLLDTAMDPDELRKMVAAGTDSIAAWESYVQLRELYADWSGDFDPSSSNTEMLVLYRKIIAADPEFAEAHLAFARIVYEWLSFVSVFVPPAELSIVEARQLFTEVSAAASRYARTETARLSAELLRARMQLRLIDQVELTEKLVALQATDQASWVDYLEALIMVSRFDDAGTVAQRAAAQDFPGEARDSVIFAFAARVDLPLGLAMAEKAISQPAPSESDYYQAHRVFLFADRVAEAAEIGRRYMSAATDPTWSLMVRIRQACAEGRLADAEALYAGLEFKDLTVSRSNIQWLALKTLGRDAEAEALLRPLDETDTLYALAGFLTYTYFDPRPFPNLSAALEAQGVQRHNPATLNFACKR